MTPKEELNIILRYAVEEAIRTGCQEIDVEHIILAAIRHRNNEVCEFFISRNIPLETLRKELNDSCDRGRILPREMHEKMTRSRHILEIIEDMPAGETPSIFSFMISAIRTGNSFFARLMSRYGITRDSFPDEDETDSFESDGFGNPETDDEEEYQGHEEHLEDFGYDITQAAAEGRLDPIVGREAEIDRLLQILSRRKKNNPLLVGEAGVGKSSIVDGVALRIAHKEVPGNLIDKRIFSLDLGQIVAGTKLRGQFEARIKNIIREVRENPDIILFIDEIHTMVGAGNGAGSLDAASMLKPALARGEFQCIGATTTDEYRNIIEKDGALDRRFQKIMVEPPTLEKTLEILSEIRKSYESFHHVRYTPEALKACATLSVRYISDRNLPDKAIDLMDEAGAKKHIETLVISPKTRELYRQLLETQSEKNAAARASDIKKTAALRKKEKQLLEMIGRDSDTASKKKTRVRKITEQDICRVMSGMTGIPLDRIALSEGNRLLAMPRQLAGKVIGQDEAIEKISKAIKRNRAGLKDPGRPIGTFLFLGSTGVGKTYLAKKLAEFLFDTDEALIRIDMSEYMEKHSVSRLIGAPPGYIGYGDGGELSEKVRHKPYSVILLDEIEKAHTDIYNLLLQVLDEGRLTDSNGKNVDFRNTVLIMTSNVGSRELAESGNSIGFTAPDGQQKEKREEMIVSKELKRLFSPEFLNRLDDIIYFRKLSPEDILKITRLELGEVSRRVKEAGYRLEISEKAIDFLARAGYDSDYGARPIRREIQKHVEDTISDAILAGMKPGTTVRLDLDPQKNRIVII